jgi:Pyrimidine dimer DNA glycosylase
MQTFLPVPDFHESARLLDYRRLGKQRVETHQLLKAIHGETRGWVNHPAAVMWRRYAPALHAYGRAMCVEWIARGYNDSMLDRFDDPADPKMPYWFGDPALHLSHRSNLIRKNPAHYSPLFASDPDNLPYVWFPETPTTGGAA